MHPNLKRQKEAAKMRTWKGESCGEGPLHRNWNLMLGYLAYLGVPGDSDAKESAFNAGDLGLIPGLGRCPGGGRGNPLQYSCLENPMDRGAWQAAVHGVAESDKTAAKHSTAPHLSEDAGREGSWGVNTPCSPPSL